MDTPSENSKSPGFMFSPIKRMLSESTPNIPQAASTPCPTSSLGQAGRKNSMKDLKNHQNESSGANNDSIQFQVAHIWEQARIDGRLLMKTYPNDKDSTIPVAWFTKHVQTCLPEEFRNRYVEALNDSQNKENGHNLGNRRLSKIQVYNFLKAFKKNGLENFEESLQELNPSDLNSSESSKNSSCTETSGIIGDHMTTFGSHLPPVSARSDHMEVTETSTHAENFAFETSSSQPILFTTSEPRAIPEISETETCTQTESTDPSAPELRTIEERDQSKDQETDTIDGPNYLPVQVMTEIHVEMPTEDDQLEASSEVVRTEFWSMEPPSRQVEPSPHKSIAATVETDLHMDLGSLMTQSERSQCESNDPEINSQHSQSNYSARSINSCHSSIYNRTENDKFVTHLEEVNNELEKQQQNLQYKYNNLQNILEEKTKDYDNIFLKLKNFDITS